MLETCSVSMFDNGMVWYGRSVRPSSAFAIPLSSLASSAATLIVQTRLILRSLKQVVVVVYLRLGLRLGNGDRIDIGTRVSRALYIVLGFGNAVPPCKGGVSSFAVQIDFG